MKQITDNGGTLRASITGIMLVDPVACTTAWIPERRYSDAERDTQRVYDIDGEHIGWIGQDAVRDIRGYVVGRIQEPTAGSGAPAARTLPTDERLHPSALQLPSPIAQLASFEELAAIDYRPIAPVYRVPHVRPTFHDSWSDASWDDFVHAARVEERRLRWRRTDVRPR